MKIIDQGFLHRGEAGGCRATATFASFTAVEKETVLSLYRVGSSKDCDDEMIEMRRSKDGGFTWDSPRTPFPEATVGGMKGTLKVVYVTALEPGHLIAAAMWINREIHPGKPLFNPATEGCLPMSVLLSDSYDNGFTWGEWRLVPVPDEIGPASLTNPIVRLADKSLILSIETNKHYNDESEWHQRVVYIYSHDEGKTWGVPQTVAQDPSKRIFYWDQRICVSPDGRLASFSWTYDRENNSYLNVHRNISADNGISWNGFEDLGFPDQGSRPAVLPDGRIVLAWVDRFNTSSIRARMAPGNSAPFLKNTETVIYQHQTKSNHGGSAGELLDEMGKWSFGLPFAEALPNGDVLVAYYAGTDTCMDCR